MDLPSTTLVDVLMFLLPGFVTAAIYFTLTPAPRPIPFERIVQALIFTMLVQSWLFLQRAAFLWLGKSLIVIGSWSAEAQVVWSVVIAVAFGLLLTWATNRDKIHALLRKSRITDQTSFSSEWYGALCRNQGYIVLHLNGARRLYGWPVEWPSVPDQGHFVMAKAEWLTEENNPMPLKGVQNILIRAQDVEMVELMAIATEPLYGDDNGRS